ncbi:hypothetical protein COX00_01340 [Candidatus Uhrbacteria bacterium CG22_combo_CG10-13_8_21_14_all_47_17]|uniref:Glycosyltransferase n=1 Tax=Candidatus Uhrbacteria bacterium CG22_combo_CG10-13_8_21_14_all_47_17 TaxID=1975041 RepID=A0A2H0BSX1_9BACT|nr:MAG: hypothetical protein COX00_01340 [Candidatus Uhrbacteria bacterium CG22_combo_CG10-13_8_21_14_all_47_17]
MDKLCITQILWTLGRGGAERMVLDLSRYLKQADHDVELLAAGGGLMHADFKNESIPVAYAAEHIEQASRRDVYDFFWRSLIERRPDIVHTHLGGDIWGGLAAKKLGLHPWIITAHSHEPGLPFLQRIGRFFAYQFADHVVCVSDGVQTAIQKTYKVSSKKMSVIRIGIDAEQFSPRPAHLAGDVPKIISVGRLVPEKGHATLLRALAKVELPWTLELVGDGPEKMALVSLAETLGILPRIHFSGITNDVAAKLKEADLFCLPSRHEGQGLALHEAAVACVPAIASDLASLREVFDAETMLFATVEDVDAWTQAIYSSLTNYGEALRRAEQAQALIKKTFRFDRMGEAYLLLYKKLLQKKNTV